MKFLNFHLFLLLIPHQTILIGSIYVGSDEKKDLKEQEEKLNCPEEVDFHFYRDSVPKKMHNYREVEVSNLKDCVTQCCHYLENCDLIVYKKLAEEIHCYHVRCYSDEYCEPSKSQDNELKGNTVMIRLVRSADLEPLEKSKLLESLRKSKGKMYKSTPDYEEWENYGEKRQEENIVPSPDEAFSPNNSTLLSDSSNNVPNPIITTQETFTKLFVYSGGNSTKTITLPQNNITVSVSVTPPGNYSYKWDLIFKPIETDDATMMNAKTDTLKLSKLKQGVYKFNVSVQGRNSAGSLIVTVIVLPPPRQNQAPIAIIQPSNVTVQLPNKDTILDGSQSKDDDKIIMYIWEPVQSPLGYEFPIELEKQNSPTLQLKNLLPGFYRFKLTVSDSNDVSNFTYANLTVLKEKDYKPTANAGEDKIIFLPQNEVILNGNSSTDDKGIKSWLWTRADDENKKKVVDMDGSRTPYLRLSNLGVGVYTFNLVVTDTMNQTSDPATVHVHVKPETNIAPIANARKNSEVFLPMDKPFILDGSESKDVSQRGIVRYVWEQVYGPKESHFGSSNESKTVVNDLIPGEYTFKLTVYNSKNLSDSDLVNVTVKQIKNFPPKSDAGDDQMLMLPLSVIVFNGSRSSDDVRIVSYDWKRVPYSISAGNIVESSDKEPILRITDVIPGRYVFNLTVGDEQGLTSWSTSSIMVKPSPHANDEIQMVLECDMKEFTYDKEASLFKTLELLLNNGKEEALRFAKIRIETQLNTKRPILIFTVNKKNGEVGNGPEIVRRLRKRIRSDPSLITPSILKLETVICQLDCSGHGKCDQYSKVCICDPFWMENPVRTSFEDRESNCDWSILYVVIITIIMILTIFGIVCSSIWFLRRSSMKQRIKNVGSNGRRKKRRSNRAMRSNSAREKLSHQYTLLGDNIKDAESSDLNGENMELPNAKIWKRAIKSDDDDDSESDVTIFDSSARKKLIENGLGRGKQVNGYRNKVKT